MKMQLSLSPSIPMMVVQGKARPPILHAGRTSVCVKMAGVGKVETFIHIQDVM